MNEPMGEYEFAEKMREASFKEPEDGHGEMDVLMVEQLRALGYGAACDIFKSLGIRHIETSEKVKR